MILNYYNEIYPLDLWVCLDTDLATAVKKFNFYGYVSDLRTCTNAVDINTERAIGGVTYLVQHKTKGFKGILIALNSNLLQREDYRFLMDLVCHESGHAVDAVYQYISEGCHTYDEGNEPHSYLLGWFAGSIGDFLTKYFKSKDECKEV